MNELHDHDEFLSDAVVDDVVMEMNILGKLSTEELMFEIRCRDEVFKTLHSVSTEELLFVLQARGGKHVKDSLVNMMTNNFDNNKKIGDE